MTLLIAVLLLYHFDMSWGWYAATLVVWAGHCLTNPVILGLIDDL